MRGRLEAERFSQIIFYATVLLIGYLAWRIVQPFVAEIGWAIVLAICFEPVRERVEPRLGRTRTAALLTAVALVLIVVPLLFVGSAMVRQGVPAVAYLEKQLRSQGGAAVWLHSAWTWLHERAAFLPSEQEAITQISASLGRFAQFVAGQAGGVLASAFGLVFSLVITMAVLFFLIRDASAFAGGLRRVLPFGEKQNQRLMAVASDLVFASVIATLAISAVQGVVGGVTFALLGIQGAVLWGVMMFVLAFLPLVGATLVWAPAAIWLALSGSFVKALILAAVGIGIMGQVDNVVRPLLLSGKSQMSTLVLIISLMGGVSAFGFIGVVVGPLVAALLIALFESYEKDTGPPSGPKAPAASAKSGAGATPDAAQGRSGGVAGGA